MKKQNELSLQDALKNMIQEYKLEPQLQEIRIRQLWETMMGATISTYTSQISLRNQVLYLTLLSAPLKQELLFARDKIRDRLNEELGEDCIRDVVIR